MTKRLLAALLSAGLLHTSILTDVLITSVRTAGATSVPSESFTLNCII